MVCILHVGRPQRAHDRRDHIRQTRLFRSFIGLALVSIFDFSLHRNRAHSLRAKRGRIHDDLQVSLCAHRVVAERNIDIVAKVDPLPDRALDKTRHTARSLPGKVISLLGIEEVNGGPVAQPRRHGAERELRFELGRHLLDRGLSRLAWRRYGHANEADCDECEGPISIFIFFSISSRLPCTSLEPDACGCWR